MEHPILVYAGAAALMASCMIACACCWFRRRQRPPFTGKAQASGDTAAGTADEERECLAVQAPDSVALGAVEAKYGITDDDFGTSGESDSDEEVICMAAA